MQRAAPKGRVSPPARRSASEPRRRLLQNTLHSHPRLPVSGMAKGYGCVFAHFCNSLRRRLLQKSLARHLRGAVSAMAKGLIWGFAHFCNGLRSSPTPSAAREHAQKPKFPTRKCAECDAKAAPAPRTESFDMPVQRCAGAAWAPRSPPDLLQQPIGPKAKPPASDPY